MTNTGKTTNDTLQELHNAIRYFKAWTEAMDNIAQNIEANIAEGASEDIAYELESLIECNGVVYDEMNKVYTYAIDETNLDPSTDSLLYEG